MRNKKKNIKKSTDVEEQWDLGKICEFIKKKAMHKLCLAKRLSMKCNKIFQANSETQEMELGIKSLVVDVIVSKLE